VEANGERSGEVASEPVWRPGRYEGLESFVGETALYRVEVVPSYGGKMVSLRDKRTGREWLHGGNGLVPRRPEGTEEDWESFDRSGWDECFPTVDPCAYPEGEWAGRPIPDHGEVWRVGWNGAVDHATDAALVLGVKGRVLPYDFEKRVRLVSESRMLVEYSVYNRSSSPLAFLWAMHPLFRVEPGMRLCLPPSVDEIVVSFSACGRLGARGDVRRWPHPLPGVDLSAVGPRGEGTAEKYYVRHPLAEGYARIAQQETGESLTVRFDPRLVPYLAVWANYGGWNGEHNLAMEPATGYLDRLDEAANTGRVLKVVGGSVARWWADLSLEAPSHLPAQGY